MGIFFNDWLGSGNRKGKIPQHPGERYFTNQESYKEEVKVDNGYNGKKNDLEIEEEKRRGTWS